MAEWLRLLRQSTARDAAPRGARPSRCALSQQCKHSPDSCCYTIREPQGTPFSFGIPQLAIPHVQPLRDDPRGRTPTVTQMAELIKQIEELILLGDGTWDWEQEADREGFGEIIEGQRYKLVDLGRFTQWKSRCEHFIGHIFGSDSPWLLRFRENTQGHNSMFVDMGQGVLGGIRDEVKERRLAPVSKPPIVESLPALDRIVHICNYFHKAVKALASRDRNKPPFAITEEYDIHWILNSYLRLDFDDVRAEETMPSTAGKGYRIDFILPDSKIGIECKLARAGQRLGEEIAVDIQAYKKHPKCETLVFFIYDPDFIIRNPAAFDELNTDSVHILIRPER